MKNFFRKLLGIEVKPSFSIALPESFVDKKTLASYKNSLYLFTGIERILTALTRQEIELRKYLNTDGEYEVVKDHEFLDFFNKPNEIHTKDEFLRIFITNYILSGEAFVRKVFDNGKLIGLINIRPDLVEVEVKEQDIIYKVYYPDGTFKTYTREEVSHIYKPTPDNPLRGSGILTPIFTRVTAEQRAGELQSRSFIGRPEGILYVEGVDAKLAEQIKKRVNHQFKEGEPVFVTSNETKFQTISLSKKDLEFIESMKFLREDIIVALGIPKELLTLEDVGKLSSSGDRGMRLFEKYTLDPLMKTYLGFYNTEILDKLYEEPLALVAPNVVRQDRKELIEEVTKLVNAGVISQNEARQELGYEEKEGYDDLKATPTLLKKIEIFQRRKKLLEKTINTIVRKKLFKGEGRYVYKNLVNRNVENLEKRFQKKAKRYFEEQKKRVVENYKAGRHPLDIKSEVEITYNFARESYEQIARRGAEVGVSLLKMITKAQGDYSISPAVLHELESRARMFAENVVGVTYDEVMKIIAEAEREGLAIDEIQTMLEETFEGMAEVRSSRIARTETGFVANLGLKDAYEQSPVVTGMEWVTAKDNRVRPEHQLNDGVVVPKGGIYPNGEHFPAEKTINCRCVLAPVLDK